MNREEFELYVSKALLRHPDKKEAIEKLKEQVVKSRYDRAVISATKKYIDLMVNFKSPEANQATGEMLKTISSMTSFKSLVVIPLILGILIATGILIYLKFMMHK